MGPWAGQLVFVKWSKTEVLSSARQEHACFPSSIVMEGMN